MVKNFKTFVYEGLCGNKFMFYFLYFVFVFIWVVLFRRVSFVYFYRGVIWFFFSRGFCFRKFGLKNVLEF